MFYTGVGSRKTPKDVLELMVKIAIKAAQNGYTLRSGGAEGADKAFEHGCDMVKGPKEIYYANQATAEAMAMAAYTTQLGAPVAHMQKSYMGGTRFRFLASTWTSPQTISYVGLQTVAFTTTSVLE